MRKKIGILFSLVLIIFTFYLNANSVIIKLKKTDSPPRIDGVLDDSVWKNAFKADEFKTFEPDYGKTPHKRTVFYMTYDSHNIYFAIRAYDDPEKIKTSLKKRDNIYDDDWGGVLLDTFNNNQKAYVFILNPSGIQGDGTIGSDGNLNETQDFVWYGAGKIDEKGYTLEFKIPLKSLRFPKGKKIVMKVGAFRNITRFSENSSFPPFYPDKGSLITQSAQVELEGLKYKRVFELLPAVVHNSNSEIEEGVLKPKEKSTDFGITTKLGITSDITMDATYNPDFSQVEADAGQIDINLRYELFYPEKRPFFQEGSEFFEFAGNTENAPLVSVVHTRRIISPIYGIKLNGKLGRKDTFLGLFTKDNIENEEETLNPYFSIFRYIHSFKDDSYIGGFITSKDESGYFNRVVGSDGRVRLGNSSIAEYHYFGSFTNNNGQSQASYGHALGLRYRYTTRKFILDTGFQDLSGDFKIDTGFVFRKGLSRLGFLALYQIYPNSSFFKKIEPFYWSYHIYDKEYKKFETFNLFVLRFTLPLNTQIRFEEYLGNEVFQGEKFDESGFGIRVNSQITKRIFFSLSLRRSGKIFYDPESPYQGYGNSASLYLQFQPFDQLESIFTFVYSDFYKKATDEKIYDYSILRNKTTFQFNKYFFFRGILEYNNYWKKLNMDILASFTYIPGTVFYVGYGSIFRKIEWKDDEYIASDRFLETKRGFFFKVSYLYRY